MILRINTTIPDTINISLLKEGQVFLLKDILAPRAQSENLLPAIIDILAEAKVSWPDLSGIQVVVKGGSFTSLRIGVLTANALAYAANLPLQAVGVDGEDLSKDNLKKFLNHKIAVPEYDGEPNIGQTKKKSKQVSN